MTLFQVYEFAFVCCSIASVALLIWDHVITFGREVHSMWGRKFSGPTVLYGLLRYGTLFEKIAIMFLASWYMTPHGCDLAVHFQIFPMILRSIGFGLFSALRVYALRRNQWPLAAFVFLLCFPSIITPAYVYAHQTSPGVDRYGCELSYLASPTVHARMRIAGIVADILGETIVIVVTVSRTFRLRNQIVPLEEEKKRPGLMQLLLRDGSIYFAALLVLSLADMLVLVFDNAPKFATRYDYWVVPYYTPVFRTIIICRFLLMLRGIYYDDEAGEADASAPAGSLRFASKVIGPMGAPVDSQFDDYSGPEPWEGDEDIVYSPDPLATGMLAIASSSGQTSEKDQGSGSLEETESSSEV
ncbi:hypothetical protein GALMADRAFT_262786 [Galerina marginata CBS 339.88]|uniref:DUF6533 domain-containing protein n=1 Tax=Galerina marginata (strain CBS 339.88) TaxID=685588 RepID=A0A067TXD4_GALM3|nr:hypothetical protein GALMADRAFT_262786 [Galerina marginata CBS 339.88]